MNATLNQRSLSITFWQHAAIDIKDKFNGIVKSSHPSQTPITDMKPDAEQMTRRRYGNGLGYEFGKLDIT